MKKNVMMRLAAILLVCVLASTCGISGTYAKYVTSDTGSDVARVAKFGVKVVIDGDSSFKNEYKTHDTGTYSGAVSVKSVDDANVVAPGTSSEDVDGGVTFTITGTPEVATKIDIEFTVNHDIYLGAGTYSDPTTTDNTDSFEVKTDYYPVKFTLKNSDGTFEVTGNLAKIKEEFEELSNTYDPNATLDETYTLTWAWVFETGNDAADTMLGNLAAGEGWNIDEVTNYDVNIDYTLKITVTQVD